MKKILLLLIFPVQFAFGQNIISLDECYQWARKNYPNLQQAEIWKEISGLKKENNRTNYLPQVSLNGQVTYQSDVTKIDIALPSISVPTVSKDQYKAFAEFRQTIWDGGLTATNAQLEDALLQSNLSQLEVELYKLNEQVAQAFFTALAIDKQKEVLAAQKKVLSEKLKTVKSGIKNQVVEKSAALALEAEMLNLEQNEIQLDAAKNAALQMLSLMTGESITENSKLEYNALELSSQNEYLRPEQMLFKAQKTQLERQSELLGKSRNPKLFGFGQAGYGKPGLNMLNDKFDTYYLVGIGLSWSAFDWKKTAREKQMLQLQQQLINQQENTFDHNLEILLAQQNQQIGKLEKLLETDLKMVGLRTEIMHKSASKLENGTVTTSDYVQYLQSETIAKLNYELHKIQLNEAREKYLLINGKSHDKH
jgi:outer membrane protein TolC